MAPDGVTDDAFGGAVSINDDGVIVVGEEEADGNVSTFDYIGATYVFVPDGSGGYETGIKLVAPSASVGDEFGKSVAIGDDGTVLVGASEVDVDGDTSNGAAYVYKPDVNGDYQLVLTLTPSSSETTLAERFGSSVAVGADGTLVVGASFDSQDSANAHAVYVYQVDDSVDGYADPVKLFAPDASSFDFFGSSVAVGDDGTIFVGANGGDGSAFSSGFAYVFVPDGAGGYDFAVELTAYDGSAADFFGRSVSINSDGSIVVGAYGDDDNDATSGSAYTFYQTADGDYVGADGTVYSAVSSMSVSSVSSLVSTFVAAVDEDQVFTGTDGDDILVGGSGDDLIAGGLGADMLTDGEGSDTFVISSLAEATDFITDFEIAGEGGDDGDVIDIHQLLDGAFGGVGDANVADYVTDGRQ
ncbi:MAG: type I secretion C-terminal target domain-containing protein [Breoghania sp.]|nr:type I secretion C-terminal target domain-containing protein [Breoghania sp.]MDJ0929809.1 type I secretion C-terminal target domain-containing protein [Breoghania sp.]